MDKFEQAIRNGIQRYEEHGYAIGPKDTLAEYILKAYRGELDDDDVSVITHAGFRLVRKTGAEMGRRGSARQYIGWEIVDPETGEVVQSLYPNSDGGIALGLAKKFAENHQKTREYQKEKAKLNYKKGPPHDRTM